MNRIDSKTLLALSGLAEELQEIIREYDAARQIADAEFAKIVAEANEKRQEVYELLDDLHREADEYFDGRSEKWQDGEKGQNYASWRDELERVRGEVEEEIEAPEIPDLEEPGWLIEIADPDSAGWFEPAQ